MPRSCAVLLALAALVQPLAAQAPAADRSAKDGRARAELVALYQSMLDALKTDDTVALRSILDSSYTWTPGNDTIVYSRTRRFESMMKEREQIDSFYVRDCRVSLYSRSAVANCLVTEKGDFGNGTVHYDILSTVTFAQVKAGWRIVSTHTTTKDSIR